MTRQEALPDREFALAASDGLLVMGDGSARRTEKAPGWLDERAAGFDAGVSAALASGDPEQLRRLDQDLGRRAAGCRRSRPGERPPGCWRARRWDGAVSYDDAPYGVGYFVATWSTPRQGLTRWRR